MKQKIIWTLVSAAISLTLNAGAQNPPDKAAPPADQAKADAAKAMSPKDTAIAYFKALTEGDVERAGALSAAPFYLGGREVLKTPEEIEAKHKEAVAQKGKRKVPEFTVSVPEDAKPLDQAVFPACEVFRIDITNTKFGLDIYVSKGDSPKVIGWANANKK